MEASSGYIPISSCKTESSEENVELLEDSSHSAALNIKLEHIVTKTEPLSENILPSHNNTIKVELEDPVEIHLRLGSNNSNYCPSSGVSVKLELEQEIKTENVVSHPNSQCDDVKVNDDKPKLENLNCDNFSSFNLQYHANTSVVRLEAAIKDDVLLEPRSHYPDDRLKREREIDDENLQESYEQYIDNWIKRETGMVDESLPKSHSQYTSSIYRDEVVDIKSENSSQPVVSHFPDGSDRFDNPVKAEISTLPSKHSTLCQELVHIDRDDEKRKIDCDDSILFSFTEETRQDDNVEYCETLLEKASHEDKISIFQNVPKSPCPHNDNDKSASQKRKGTLTRKKAYECSTCGKTYLHNFSLARHIGVVHNGEKPHGCPTCGKTFNQKWSLNKHITIHTNTREKPGLKHHVKSHECPTCGKQFSYDSQLKSHTKRHTGEKPYMCPECGKKFMWRSVFTSHMNSHSIKNHPEECLTLTREKNQFSPRKSTSKNHIGINTGEKPYEYPECGKQLPLKRGLVDGRVKSRGGEKSFTQSTCGETFSQSKSMLKENFRIHTRDGLHECSLCGKQFCNKSMLDRHIYIHTGEKPFECFTCGRAFYEKSKLIRHMRIHNT